MSAMQEKYNKAVSKAMMEKFRYKSKMAVPKITKVVINTGFGKIVSGKSPSEQKPIQEAILNDLTTIAGQHPTLKKTKKSIAGFKIREGMILGAAAILRGGRMYDFLERLVYTALPRMRDFRGIDRKSFDDKGNLNIGIKEHVIFPEILPEKVKNPFGLEITVVTTANTKEEGIELLSLLGFPIKAE
ncbi:MAG: 50S ribosomal protein L5, large subunit ribosomal protein L5 [Parcubacteria group bacterium GW2011_GWC1_38_6]|nr:MAG: 50S ribosomal protein L5 [Parcubacteria group bacterium GW2011_GWA1_36_12]KKQ77318.1 MAG: 50S ribosomal protein L5, large subunit ribosomal protein L5 [Parcubacteria group bacterium GW2011_GWC1_38_6]